MFAQQIHHVVERLNSIESRTSFPWITGSMGRFSIELVINHYHGSTAISGYCIHTGGMPVEYRINAIEQSFAYEIHLTSATLLSRRTVDLDGSTEMIGSKPLTQ